MATTSALVVPVFIWHAPPSHNVTASYLSLEHGKFITASDKGHVVIWKFFADGDRRRLEPQVICFTQEAVAIYALEIGPHHERECLIGLDQAGSIFVWSLSDGQCQVSKSNIFKCSPTCLKLLPDRRHLAASGHSPYVEVLDLYSMRVVRRFGPHQEWLCQIDWCVHAKSPMLVSVSLDNLFRMWMLDDDLLKGSDAHHPPKEEHLAVMMIPLTEDRGAAVGKPRQATVSPSGCGLLIVHDRHVSVFGLPITNTNPNWHIRSNTPIIAAFWCDDLTVLIFNALGQGFLHRLPRSVLPLSVQTQSGPTTYSSMLFGHNSGAPHPSGGTSSAHSPLSGTPLATDHTTQSLSPASASISPSLLTKRVNIRESGHLQDIFRIPSSWKPSISTDNGTLLAELVVPEAIRRTFAVTEIYPGGVDNFVYLVHGNGQVIMWELPLVWEKDMIQSQLHPTLEARLSEGWATKSNSNAFSNTTPLSKSPPTIPLLNLTTGSSSSNQSHDSLRAELSESRLNQSSTIFRQSYVTASLVLEKKLQLISGYSDGTITTSKLPLDMNPRSWRAHNSRINALLLMACDNKEYLISGSSDFYIRVWDLEAEPPILVHTFANHCGPVRALFTPDLQDVRRKGWKHRFFSIGEDRIVGLFGVDRTPHCVRVFPNHPAPISQVRWRPDEDYILVSCNDGSLSIWEMESGTLENYVRGADAESMLSFAKPLSKWEAGAALKPVSRQSITGVSIPIEGESPVQAVLLNIKYLSQELAEHLQAFDQQRALHQARMREASSGKLISPRSILSQSDATISGTGTSPSTSSSSATSTTTTTTTSMSKARTSEPPKIDSSDDASKNIRLNAKTTSKIVPKKSSTRDLPTSIPQSDAVTANRSGSAPISKEFISTPASTSTMGGTSTTNASAAPVTIGGANNPRLSLFLSAAQLGAYRSCAYLLPWGLDQDNDQLVIAQLYLKPPKPPVSYGMLGVDGNMSVLVPRASQLAGRWQCSDSLTALHTLASMAVAKCLLAYDVNESLQTNEQRNASSHLMSYFCVLLPEKVPHFIYPSLTVLAAFWQDPLEDISQAARSIFSSVLGRLSHEQRRLLAIAWGNLLMRNTNITSETTAIPVKNSGSIARGTPTSAFLRNQSVLVLSILGCEYPESLPTELAAHVALELLEIIFEASNSRMRVAAAELFGKGFQLWSQHLHEEANTLIHRLFKLAMVSEPKNLSKTAARALMLIGEKIPGRFTLAISQRFADLIKSGGTVPSSITSPNATVGGSANNSPASPGSSSSASSSSIYGNSSSPSAHSLTHSHTPGSVGSSLAGGALQGILAASADAISPPPSVTTNVHTPNAYVQSLREHAKVLVIVGRLVKAHRFDFYPELPVLVEAIVKSLHPHIPGLRDATLHTATNLLNLMVGLYPMLAIDLGEQRLAVGTRDGLVHVYDLNTATRVHTLQCHAPYSVSAVAFAGSNKILATYSLETGQVKVWKNAQSLFGILSGEPQCSKQFEVPCSVSIPTMSLSGGEPPVEVVNLKNLSEAAPPSSKTIRDLRQKKVAKINGSPSPSSKDTSSSSSKSNTSSLTLSVILEGLSFSWPTPKSIKIQRKWEDPALSSLNFPV